MFTYLFWSLLMHGRKEATDMWILADRKSFWF